MPAFDDKTCELGLGNLSPPDGESSVTACLVIIAGTEVGRFFVLSQPEITIGRAPGSSIYLQDDGVSRHHALLRRAGTREFTLQDLGSTNGTFCNGVRVKTAQLNDGDKLMIGSTTIFKFSFNDEVEKRFREHLFDTSVRDWLTKCFNKRYFADQLRREFANANRGTDRPLSLLMLDLDHFKQVNDTYGHTVGDTVLREVAAAVQKLVPADTVCARFGGEEFVVLLPRCDRVSAYALAERIREIVAALHIEHEETLLSVTLSIGVATTRAGELQQPDDLVRKADELLYRAKAGGRNRTEH